MPVSVRELAAQFPLLFAVISLFLRRWVGFEVLELIISIFGVLWCFTKCSGLCFGVKETALNKKGWWRWGSLTSVDFGGGLKYTVNSVVLTAPTS